MMDKNSLAHFVSTLQRDMCRQYDRQVNKDLSQQNSHDLLLRNITLVLSTAYEHCLAEVSHIEDIHYDEITPLVNEMTTALVDYALNKHRTSCALSNFPEEHQPSSQYLSRILQSVETTQQHFQQQLSDELSGQQLLLTEKGKGFVQIGKTHHF